MKIAKITGCYFLALALLMATVGVSYSMHFCKGEMERLTLYPELQGGHAADCCSADASGCDLEKAANPTIQKTSCCKNVSGLQKLQLQTLLSQIEKRIASPLILLPLVKVENTIPLFPPQSIEMEPDIGGRTMQPIAGLPIFLFLCRLRIPS